MGYETSYSLSVMPITSELDRVSALIQRLYNNGDPFDGSCKWYEHNDHLEEASRLFPHLLLILDGEGSESGDIWRKVYLNGQLVFEWRLDPTPPEIPPEILKLVELSKQARIAILKEELKRLEESTERDAEAE